MLRHILPVLFLIVLQSELSYSQEYFWDSSEKNIVVKISERVEQEQLVFHVRDYFSPRLEFDRDPRILIPQVPDYGDLTKGKWLLLKRPTFPCRQDESKETSCIEFISSQAF